MYVHFSNWYFSTKISEWHQKYVLTKWWTAFEKGINLKWKITFCVNKGINFKIVMCHQRINFQLQNALTSAREKKLSGNYSHLFMT